MNEVQSGRLYMVYLSLGLDGGSMIQEDLYNPDMTISCCAVQWSQLILEIEDI